VGGTHLVFDTGPAKLLRLGEAGIPFERLTDVFYTHLHPDHTSDLLPLLFARNAPGIRNSDRLTLWGPDGLAPLVEGLQSLWGSSVDARSYRLEVRRFPGEVRGEGWRVRARQVRHVPGALGYRLEAQGRVVAYSGDTGYTEAVVELARGADLAVLDCSFPDDQAVEGHMSPGLCGRVAREAGARRLLLTHLYPECEAIDAAAAAAREFAGEVLVAQDLMRLEL
jgi:ribonuclease BN (tRNA processing enzyme)